MKKEIEPIVKFFDLHHSELAEKWQDENGKIYDVEKYHRYLTETFHDPLKYILHTINEHLKENDGVMNVDMTN